MNTDQNELLLYFAVSLMLGLFSGVLYDLVSLRRILRKGSGGGRADTALTFFEDILFFVLFSSVFCTVSYHFNSCRFRIEAVLLAVLGFSVYRKTLHRFSEKLISFVFCVLKRFSAFVFKTLLFPVFRFVFNLTKIPVCAVYTHIAFIKDIHALRRFRG